MCLKGRGLDSAGFATHVVSMRDSFSMAVSGIASEEVYSLLASALILELYIASVSSPEPENEPFRLLRSMDLRR